MLSAINHPNRSRRERTDRARQKLTAIRDGLPPAQQGLRPQRGLLPEEVAELRARIESVINDLDLMA